MVKKDKLFVKSRVRNYTRSRGFRVSSKVLNGSKLNLIIKSLLDKAVQRTKANKRKNVRSYDLYIKPLIYLPNIDKKLLAGLVEELQSTGIISRGIMYYDIVTHIIRDVHEEPEYDQIMLWCNANIKNGHTFLE